MKESYRIFLQQPAVPEYLVPLIQELRNRLGDRFILETGISHRGTDSSAEFLSKTHDGEVAGVRLMEMYELPRSTSWFHSSFAKEVRRGDVVVLTGNPRILSNFPWAIQKGSGTVWWGQGWGSNTTKLSARIRIGLSNLFDVRLFYDELESALVGRWASSPTLYINNTIAYSDPSQLILRDGLVPSLCFIGRLTEKSGVLLLPPIVEGLLQRGVRAIRMGIIGEGPEMPSLKTAISSSGLSEQFVFHGAMFNREVVSRVLREYYYLIYPGAIGLTTQHALSEGLPVITHGNYEGHNPEARLLKDGINAIFSEPTVSGFVEACCRALELPREKYVEMQRSCVDIRRTHSISLMANRFIEACDVANAIRE